MFTINKSPQRAYPIIERRRLYSLGGLWPSFIGYVCTVQNRIKGPIGASQKVLQNEEEFLWKGRMSARESSARVCVQEEGFLGGGAYIRGMSRYCATFDFVRSPLDPIELSFPPRTFPLISSFLS